MLRDMDAREARGQVITVRGLVDPAELGKVLMHEHLHMDFYDWEADRPVREERPNPARATYLRAHAVPLLKECRGHGCRAVCDVTMPPWRAWPDLYRDISGEADFHIVLATGFYREIELGTYFARTLEDQIWPLVRTAPVEALEDLCVHEILDGIHGTGVHAGVLKLGTSGAALTAAETKAFRAGARAQRRTGVLITTHCTVLGAESSQLTLLDAEGVDLSRVVVGHTHPHLSDARHRATCLEWMKRGARFMPTNLDVRKPEVWADLVVAIHEVFQRGYGANLVLGLDSGYCSESGPFSPMTFLPEPPFLYMFTDVLPALRGLGLTPEEESVLLERNPRQLLAVS